VTELTRELHDIRSLLAVLDSDSRYWETSRIRWKETSPHIGLTWGRELSGTAFIEKVVSWARLDSTRTILELGPGYGRLLKSLLEKRVPFNEYYGIDISEKNVAYLSENFKLDGIHFIHADAETWDLGVAYDAFLSSLTMKHLYPTFERVLANLTRFANPGCMFCFDLIEGNRRLFESDKVTYIKWYTRDEVEEILARIPLQLVSFDEVQHDPEYRRLFVVARKAVDVNSA
jgi:SAM-dependent methyltransferase